MGYRHRFKQKRLLDYVRAFEEAVSHAMEYAPGVVVFGGDLVHHTRPDPVTMRRIFRILVKVADSTHIIVSIGNHEIEGHLGTTYSPIYSDLHPNIHVLTTENPHVSLNVDGRTIVFHGFEYLRSPARAEETLRKISDETVKDGKQ